MFFGSIGFAFRTAESDTFSLFSGKGFFRAHADEIAFDFCGQAEGKCEYLAGNVVSKTVVVFDTPDVAALGHAYSKDFHDHEEVSAKPGELCTDNNISFTDTLEKFSELAFTVCLCSADGLFYPAVDGKLFPDAECADFKPLILNSLFVAADPDVAIYHVNLPPQIINVKHIQPSEKWLMVHLFEQV